jgi:5-methylcytosine-specific restriction endonuclease McrA
MKTSVRRPNHQCDACGKDHYVRPFQLAKNDGKAFCSNACFGKHSRKNLTTCKVCGKDIDGSIRSKTCSRTCANKSRIGTTYRNGRKNCKVTQGDAVRKCLIEIRGDPKCERCGYDKIPNVVVIHHVIERCQGGSDDPENLEFLCPTCHAEEHFERRQQAKEGAWVGSLNALEARGDP